MFSRSREVCRESLRSLRSLPDEDSGIICKENNGVLWEKCRKTVYEGGEKSGTVRNVVSANCRAGLHGS